MQIWKRRERRPIPLLAGYNSGELGGLISRLGRFDSGTRHVIISFSSPSSEGRARAVPDPPFLRLSAMSGSGKNFERGASPANKRTLLVAEGKSGERAGGYRQL